MIEEEIYTDMDVSDAVEDSEQFGDNEDPQNISTTDSVPLPDSEIVSSEEQNVIKKPQISNKTEVVRVTKLPISRIKSIMKMDPDVNVITADALFLVTKATEMFLETVVKETYSCLATTKRKTIAKRDLELVFNNVDCLCFLEGAMDF